MAEKIEEPKKEIKTFDQLIAEASADLSDEDKKWLAEHAPYETVRGLESVLEKLKQKIPGTLLVVEGRESLIIPDVEESIVGLSKTSGTYSVADGPPFLHSFSGNQIHVGLLYKQYPAQKSVKLVPKKLSKEVDWDGLLDTFGDLTKLREHVLTPKQVQQVIKQIQDYEKGKRFEYLVFMEGYEHTPEQQITDDPRILAIHILRIFVGEMKERDFDKPYYRHIDWNFLGSMYPVEVLSDGLPIMRGSGCWFDKRTFEDSIILWKDGFLAEK